MDGTVDRRLAAIETIDKDSVASQALLIVVSTSPISDHI